MLAYVSGDRCCVTVNANFSLFLPARAKILNVSNNSYSCKLYFYRNNYIFTKMGEKFYKGKSSFKIEKKKRNKFLPDLKNSTERYRKILVSLFCKKKKKIIRDSIRLRFVEFIEKFLRASKNLRDNAKSYAQSW